MALSGGWRNITTTLPFIGRKRLLGPSHYSRNSSKSSEIIYLHQNHTPNYLQFAYCLYTIFCLSSYIFYIRLSKKSFISKSVHLGTFLAFLPSRDLAVVISLQVLQNLFELFLRIFTVSYAPCVSIFSPRRNRLV